MRAFDFAAATTVRQALALAGDGSATLGDHFKNRG